MRIIVGEEGANANLLNYQYRVGAFILMGVASGLGAVTVRKWKGMTQLLTHLFGGFTAGLGAAVIWGLTWSAFNCLSSTMPALFASTGYGFLFGVCVWGVPDDLYAGGFESFHTIDLGTDS